MEQVKRARGGIRATITRTCNESEAELAKETPDLDHLQMLKQRLVDKSMDILVPDEQIITAILVSADYTDELLAEESLAIEEYKDKIRLALIKLEKVLVPKVPPASEYGSAQGGSMKKTFKLPKIELRKFNGELTDWLGFWAQFSKIHEDVDLHESDKFHYLVQAMLKGTRARDLVESYPQTAANYPKVITALKDRFGDNSLLVEVYVRELQQLVIANVSSREKTSLAQMYDKLESHLRALETLGCTTQQNASMLYPMVESSLPEDVLRAWNRSPLSIRIGLKEEPPKTRLDFLMEFLKTEVKGEQRITLAKGSKQLTPVKEAAKRRPRAGKPTGDDDDIPTAAGLHVGDRVSCIFCERPHESRDCFRAQEMSYAEKEGILKSKKCCSLCLRSRHASKLCRAFLKCVLCGKKHEVLMCPDLPSHKKTETPKKSTTEVQPEVSNTTLACSDGVLLKTIMVTIVGPQGKHRVRALLDDGSQRSYILNSKVEELGLQSIGSEELVHALFSGVLTKAVDHKKYEVKVRTSEGHAIFLTVLGQSRICGVIPRPVHGPWMDSLKERNITLSDVGTNPRPIEMLLGADVIGGLLTGIIIQLPNGLTAVETILGWTVMGGQSKGFSSNPIAGIVTSLTITNASVEDLWALDAIGIHDPVDSATKLEKAEATRQHFLSTVSRSHDGRYSVSLPWVSGKQPIPTNFNIAHKRLETLTKKLRSSGLYDAYGTLFKDWLGEGFIEEVPKDEMTQACHYLPHRAVLKPESSTTPIRPVFDASCKTLRTPSLNDCLEKGPNLLELIPAVLLRFREKRIGLVADIRKAFQMVSVNVDDRDFLRFLWWEDVGTSNLRIFRHKRVVFGVNSSPFLLAAVIEYHLSLVDEERRAVAEQLLKSLYVDNSVTSVDTLEDYEEFKSQATLLMAEAKMDLRLWQKNSVEESGVGSCSWECGLETGREEKGHTSPETSVLGLKWDLTSDTLSLNMDFDTLPREISKRIVLSNVQKVFDPLGISCPATLRPKLMIQKLWGEKVPWDQELSVDQREEFQHWMDDLKALGAIRIPRLMTGGSADKSSWQIHAFGDASRDAYAAVVFLRTSDRDKISVQLLQAKSRVAPLKAATIPRLELLSCTITALLTQSIKKALSLEVPTFYWSDSTTALAWIRRNDEWGTFVGNRGKTICSVSEPEFWRHVPGTLNPADLPSRGCSPSHLLKSRWWEGPSWLRQSEDHWPSGEPLTNEDSVIAERKKSAVQVLVTSDHETPWYVRQSSLKTNLVSVAWLRRFLLYLDKGSSIVKGPLTVAELDSSELAIWRLVQREYFPQNQDIICGLRVERRDDGLLHVRTKLTNRKDTEGFRFPILVPHSHPLTIQLIREEHFKLKHAGVQILMGALREKYWIIQGRKAIRAVVDKCTICRRFSCKKPCVVPSALPEDRVKSSKVFEVVGVDFAGPVYLKNKEKAWIALFTCAVYRCLNLELVNSLSTDAFLDALARFTSRNGRPTVIYSDNGTNFLGTNNALKDLDWDRISKTYGLERIVWKFNPPSAPWWGGWWERLVRSVKELLRRTLRKTTLSYDKLRTILSEIEAVINGRPLTTVTEDPDDLRPLTPAMFMHEISCPSMTDRELLDVSGFRKLYQEKRTLLDDLKTRFRREYLSQLVQRGKEKSVRTFRVGDVVLVGADNKRRWEWPMARIVELLPGKDGHVRVAKVKTAVGILTRPIQHLNALEVSSPEDKPPQPTTVQSSDETPEPEAQFTRSGRKVKAPVRYGVYIRV